MRLYSVRLTDVQLPLADHFAFPRHSHFTYWRRFVLIALAISLCCTALASRFPRILAQARPQNGQMQSHVRRISDWTQGPSTGTFSVEGFGDMSKSSGSGVTYKGNVGSPYGSNIIEVSADTARNYQNVVRFTGCNTDSWVVVIWNKYGPDDKMDGWYGHACHHFTLMPGEAKFFAFMNNSQGGFAAAEGSSIPTDSNDGYASTWGEWDFASLVNANWSGFDVSAISAQDAGLEIQGMKICEANSGTCSSITASGGQVDNAYTIDNRDVGGVGGNLPAGQVRLAVAIDY